MLDAGILDRMTFTADQRAALAAIDERIDASPEARALYHADASALSAGGEELVSASEARQGAFDALWELYPAYVLLGEAPALREKYHLSGIPEAIFFDTLAGIPLWMNHFERKNGRMGLKQFEWLSWCLRFRLFRLGRLEYIFGVCEMPAYAYVRRDGGDTVVLADSDLPFDNNGRLVKPGETDRRTRIVFAENAVTGRPVLPDGHLAPRDVTLALTQWRRALAPGDPVIQTHIPEGAPLAPESVLDSLARAPAFFERYFHRRAAAFQCESWLMSPSLAHILPDSNIARFQRLFRSVPFTTRDKQVFERVYGRALTRWEDMPMDTALRRGVAQWYGTGGDCRSMFGFRLIGEEQTI